MTPLSRQDVLAHQSEVPWPVPHQVEQDLLLCRSMVALFNDPFLKGQIAMRGGTVLHKVHLAPASRYSEDIDLVVIGDRPEEHIRAAVKRVLHDVLGPHKRWGWEEIKLAIRDVAKPSRVLRVIYELRSVVDPGRTLTVVVDANVTERRPHRPVVELPFGLPFRDGALETRVNSFDIHNLKMFPVRKRTSQAAVILHPQQRRRQHRGQRAQAAGRGGRLGDLALNLALV